MGAKSVATLNGYKQNVELYEGEVVITTKPPTRIRLEEVVSAWFQSPPGKVGLFILETSSSRHEVEFYHEKYLSQAETIARCIDRPKPDPSFEEDEKRCPACAETIRAAAKKCKHCGEFVEAWETPRPKALPLSAKPSGVPTPTPTAKGCLGLIAVMIFFKIVGSEPSRTSSNQSTEPATAPPVASKPKPVPKPASPANPPKQTAKAAAVPPQPKQTRNDPASPSKLVTILSQPTNFNGMQCFLEVEGEGWQASRAFGGWYAILRRSFGENEVSCLLESDNAATAQRITLEAEFYQPGLYENEMLLQFGQSSQVLMHPMKPPQEFAEALVNMTEWSNSQWELTRESYENGGFGLTLRKK